MTASPEALARAKAGDDAAMEELVEQNAALIWSVARRFFGRAEPEDLFQLGSIGFLKAVRGFDPTYGTAFSTYAVPKIAGEMLRFLRDDGPVKVSRTLREQSAKVAAIADAFRLREGREPHVSELAELTGLTPEELASCIDCARPPRSLDEQVGEDGSSLYELLSAGESGLLEHIALREAIGKLDMRQRQVILLRFYRDMTQQDAARVLGLTQVQVSRLESKAVRALRDLMAEKG